MWGCKQRCGGGDDNEDTVVAGSDGFQSSLRRNDGSPSKGKGRTTPASSSPLGLAGCCAVTHDVNEAPGPFEEKLDSRIEKSPVPRVTDEISEGGAAEEKTPQRADDNGAEDEQEQLPVWGCCGLCSESRLATDAQLLQDTTWCSYCICCGCGSDPRGGTCHSKCTCVFCTFECQPAVWETADGVCNHVQTCCFCTKLVQLPPREGTPLCMLCGMKFGALQPGNEIQRRHKEMEKERCTNVDDLPFDFWDWALFEQFPLCYYRVCGCIGHPSFMDPLQVNSKCGGCKCRCGGYVPVNEDGINGQSGICHNICSIGHCRSQAKVPPISAADGNPICACGGWRFRKTIEQRRERKQKAKAARVSKVPVQEIMQERRPSI